MSSLRFRRRRDGDVLGTRRRDSYGRLAVADGLSMFSALTFGSAFIGLFDSGSDSLELAVVAAASGAIGLAGRHQFVRRERPPASRVISALASTWAALVLVGTVVYIVTGTIPNVGDAVFESAVGFSTVSATTVDPEALSLSMALFRGSTQWMGGALGLLAGVVALPSIMKGNVQVPKGAGRRADRLAPTTLVGRRRVLALYSVLTVACGVLFAATGMSVRGSAVHAMTTLSSGGLSDNADSFVGESSGSRMVATFFMFVAGMSLFAIWWLIRGNTARFRRSPELRLYVAIVATATAVLVWQADNLAVADALFTAVSASSTTGHAVTDWTVFPDGVLSVMLLVVATGSMGASAGGGLRIVRVLLLASHAASELRRQLNPSAVISVKHSGRPVSADELDQLTGYQVAHFGLAGIGAFVLSVTGLAVTESLWTAVSVISTYGPGPGLGPFGDARKVDEMARLLLIPGMLAGRLSVLPLLLAAASIMRIRISVTQQARRLFRGVRR